MSKTIGLLGRKVGMTRVFGDDGTITPVTVVEAGPCPVTQVKTTETDGYNALQIAYGDIAERLVNKPSKGHQDKAGKGYKRSLKELRLDSVDDYELGQDLTVELFAAGDKVKVTGTSKGKGFAGVMKRWNFAGLRATHGTEKAHRSGGSIGNATFPGRVIKGKKMAGHMGAETVTCINLEVVDVRPEYNLLLIKGQVPGAKNGLLMIRKQS